MSLDAFFISGDGFEVNVVGVLVSFQMRQRARHQRQRLSRVNVFLFVIFDERLENLPRGFFLTCEIQDFSAAQIGAQPDQFFSGVFLGLLIRFLLGLLSGLSDKLGGLFKFGDRFGVTPRDGVNLAERQSRLRFVFARAEKLLRVRFGFGILPGFQISLQQALLSLPVFRIGLKQFGEREDGRLILAVFEFVFGRFALSVLRRGAGEGGRERDKASRE
ncbi:MAG: hypothetical protein JMDDDDMK_04625 [Acidobacteria bacterium]|nr:hypothetical protein [Acidobacteriota bacterium]